MIQYFPTVTGSLTVNGDLIVTGTGSMSASLALNSNLLQGTGSTGFATTASLLAVSSSQQQISASLLTLTASYTALSSSYTALSGSYNTFSGSASTRVSQIESVYATTGSNSFRANQSITGSLVVSSTITAQTLIVQTVTSSIVYSSGSNIFGSQLSNTQTFTGSIQASGSSTHFLMGGNVGIGTISPQARLESYYFGGATSNLGDNIVLGAGTDGGVVGTFTQIGLGYHNRNAGNYFPTIISSVIENSSGQNAEGIVFATRNAITGTTRPTERMRITASGSVGIGTSSPSFASGGGLAIYNATRSNLSLTDNTNTLSIFQQGVNSYLNNISTGDMIFRLGTGSDERMRITSAGNIGIGVTNPQRQFVIADSSGNGLEISNSSGYSTLLAYNRTTSAYQNIVLGEGTGKVGIGITNPSYKLQVRPTTDVNMIVTNNGSNLQIGSSNDAGNAAIPINFTATSFTFNSATTFSSSVTATGGLFGKSYAQTSSSGSYSVVDTGIYNSVDYSSGAIWLVSYGGNPLAAGSNYFANYFGALSVTTGYIGGSVKQYIQYSAFSSFDASGVGNLSFTPSFWNGTSELTTIPNASTSYQIRIKIGTYNPVGSGQYVYLLKMGQ